MHYSKELIKGTTKNLILAVLFGGELYGYQIARQISEHSQGKLEFGEGSIYPALHALEFDGLLKSRWVPQDNRPDRKYYQLTDKGLRELKANIKQWEEFSGAVSGVLNAVKSASVA